MTTNNPDYTALIENTDWALSDIEPVLAKLRHDARLIGHLATCENEVETDDWLNVENALLAGHKELERLWNLAWDQCQADSRQYEADIAAVKAAAKAEKAAPGSPDDAATVDARWRLLAAAVAVAADGCRDAGYQIKPLAGD